MDRVAFLLPFVGIIVGLGVADLLLSVHRAVRSGRRWHWLPATWTVVTFFLALLYWWVFSEIVQSDAIGTFGGFSFHLLSPVLLFLTCAAALPDAEGEEPLLDYYLGNRRYFFGLLAAYLLHAALDYIFGYGSGWDPFGGLSPPWIALGLAALAAVLAATGKRSVHAVCTGLVLASLLLTVGRFTRVF